MTATSTAEDNNTVRRVADYEQISGILWLILGVIQTCLLITIIAGIWNIFAGISRIKFAKKIRLNEPGIVEGFEPINQLVVIGVVNVILGAFVGVVFVAFDFYIRDLVISNRRIFEKSLEPYVYAKSEFASDAARSPESINGHTGDVGYMEEIRCLARLKEDGLITEEEFSSKKAKILGLQSERP